MGELKHNGVIVGWELEESFPAGDGDDSCMGSGVIISYGVQLFPQYRGQGLGQRFHQERLDRWVKNDYTYALCTVRRDNDPQLAILKKNGWVRLANTASMHGQPIYIMGRNLK